jgi:RHS repeat-associated protein
MKRHRNPRRVSRSTRPASLEQLESRTMLAGNAAHVFATFDGAIGASGTSAQVPISIAPADFTLPHGRTTLGFHVVTPAGSELDPAAVRIQDAHGAPVTTQYAVSDLKGATQSLTLASLHYGTYRLIVGGDRGTSGAFHLDVFLAGDVNGDRTVDRADGILLRKIFGAAAGDGHYRVEADANLDGRITSYDYAQWRRNLGDSTGLNPLNLTAKVSPDPVTLPDGTLVTNVASTVVVGSALRGVTAALETGSDDAFDEGTAIADATGGFALSTTLAEGTNMLRVRAEDGFGQVRTATIPLTLDTHPPSVTIADPASGLTTNQNVTITGTALDRGAGVATLRAEVDSGPAALVALDPSGQFSFATGLALDGSADGTHNVDLVATDRAGNDSLPADVSFTLDTRDPTRSAPPLDPTIATPLLAATQFLYTGSDPIQTGVAPGTITLERAAVLRGQVRDRDGAPIPGVTITILAHPEFGTTTTRVDGLFDMAVNGGGLLTVNYAKAGYLPAQRQIDAPWQDYAWLPDLVMTPQDSQVSPIDLMASTSIQVARGGPVSDERGTRQATLLFSQGTQATMTMPDGRDVPLTSLHVRATEYTVGPDGLQAMPGELPANSAYTYAVSFNADEATAAGATGVRFSKPVSFYVENFIGFPVGGNVPTGYYDHARGQWVASDNGQVIQILDVKDGNADLDIDGSGQPADVAALAALGITDAERRQLAAIYQPGQSLWRVPISHFSDWDSNWGLYPPADAVRPNLDPRNDRNVDHACQSAGSIIDIQNQVLGEDVGVVGTPFSLDYASDREPGRESAYTLEIPLTGPTYPPDLKRIVLDIDVAGRHFSNHFDTPAPNMSRTFTWDGKDGYGRMLQGAQPVTVTISYVYYASYQAVPRFGYDGNGLRFTGFRGSIFVPPQLFLSRTWRLSLGPWGNQADDLGGWSLDVHHAYDPLSRVLYLGDGQRRSADELVMSSSIRTVAGNGNPFFGRDGGDGGSALNAMIDQPAALAVGPDGSLYIADVGNDRIRRVDRDGTITTVAGNGTRAFAGDGGPATQASLYLEATIGGLAIGSNGSLYIADTDNGRIRRVGPDGIITTVAGGGSGTPDAIPASQARISPAGIALDTDGSLYIADFKAEKVLKLSTDGLITTVAGDGMYGSGGDGGPATQAHLRFPTSVTVGPGGLYIMDTLNFSVRKVSAGGIITTVAGGQDALGSILDYARGIAVGGDGNLYIADTFHHRVLLVGADGHFKTVAGTNGHGFSGDDGPGTDARLNTPYAVAVGPDSSLYIADGSNNRVRRLQPPLQGFVGRQFFIPSEDGSEIYTFDEVGRHLTTRDARTGALLYQFAYDAAGHLASVTDAYGNVTTIERNADGTPTAIIAPFGQRTTLALEADGNLAGVANPAGESVQLTYSAGGLLSALTDPRGNLHRFSYDDQGRLIKDEDPLGGFKSLARSEQDHGFSVALTTAGGMTTTYQLEYLPDGGQRRVNTCSCGLTTVDLIVADGSQTITAPDGTVTTEVLGPDPRFGMLAPLTASLIVKTPSGLTSTVSAARSITLSNPGNILGLATQTDTLTLNGRTYTSMFDAASGTITGTSPEGRTETASLDSHGRVVAEQVPGLDPVEISYDARGRLASVDQGSRHEAFAYDSQGNLASVTDPLSQRVAFSHDAAGRVTDQTLADGSQLGFSYDASGNLTSLTPPDRPQHTFSYDGADLVQTYSPPDIGTGSTSTQYSYNLDHRLIQVQRPDGIGVSLGYDDHGRLISIAQPRGTTRLTYDDASGNLTGIESPDHEVQSYGYDGGLMTDAAWSGLIAGTIHLTYDKDQRVSSESIDGASPIVLQYNRDGLLAQAGSITLNRDAQSGRLTSTTLGQVTDSFGYDAFGDIDQYRAAAGGTNLIAEQYTSDALGRITQKVETIDGVTHTEQYSYDSTGRLIEVQRDGSVSARYSYDANGNRLSATGPDGTIQGKYDAQDRLITYGTQRYTYSANGDLQSKTDTAKGRTTRYTYDGLGNLTAVTLPDGKQVEYIVDGWNRRVGRKVDGTLVQGFLYRDGLNPMAELDGNNDVVTRFVYGSRVSVPDYLIKGGVTYRIITDQLGSPRLIVDAATGHVAQRMDYDAFGNVTVDTNPGFQPFGFAGGLYDRDTGLVRFGARDYDAKTGRWTSKDPIVFNGGDPNLYGYGLNDPVNRLDPAGLKWYDHFDWLQPASDFFAGFGDTLSFGLTDLVREAIDVNDVVNTCSGWYAGGELAGVAWFLAFDAIGAEAAAEGAVEAGNLAKVSRGRGIIGNADETGKIASDFLKQLERDGYDMEGLSEVEGYVPQPPGSGYGARPLPKSVPSRGGPGAGGFMPGSGKWY